MSKKPEAQTPPPTPAASSFLDDLLSPLDALADITLGRIFDAPVAPAVPTPPDVTKETASHVQPNASSSPVVNVNLSGFGKLFRGPGPVSGKGTGTASDSEEKGKAPGGEGQ